jgi:hypothetical protein
MFSILLGLNLHIYLLLNKYAITTTKKKISHYLIYEYDASNKRDLCIHVSISYIICIPFYFFRL